jgi:hypothetical protein
MHLPLSSNAKTAPFICTAPSAVSNLLCRWYETVNDNITIHTNHPIIKACHTYIGNISAAAGKYPFICGLNMSMSTEYQIRRPSA